MWFWIALIVYKFIKHQIHARKYTSYHGLFQINFSFHNPSSGSNNVSEKTNLTVYHYCCLLGMQQVMEICFASFVCENMIVWKGKIMVSFCISTCKWCLKMSLLIIPQITMTWVDAMLFLQQRSMQCYEFHVNGTWPERASILPVDDYYLPWEQDGTSLFLQWWVCFGRISEFSTDNNNILIDNTE